MIFKVGDVYRSNDGFSEIEIAAYDPVTKKYKYVLRDQFSMSTSWEEPEDIEMLIQVTGMGGTTDLFSKPDPDKPTTCYHWKKEKKLCFNQYYWKCIQCGQEFDNE